MSIGDLSGLSVNQADGSRYKKIQEGRGNGHWRRLSKRPQRQDCIHIVPGEQQQWPGMPSFEITVAIDALTPQEKLILVGMSRIFESLFMKNLKP
jgi:hypothetical protein